MAAEHTKVHTTVTVTLAVYSSTHVPQITPHRVPRRKRTVCEDGKMTLSLEGLRAQGREAWDGWMVSLQVTYIRYVS